MRPTQEQNALTNVLSMDIATDWQAEMIASAQGLLLAQRKIHVAASMRNLTCHRSVDVQNIVLSPEQGVGLVDNPKGVVFPDPTFVEEVILEKIEIGFGRIVRRKELSIGRDAQGRLRNLANDAPWAERCLRDRKGRRTSLTIRSRVLMIVPLSRRCIERSTAGLFVEFLCSIS